MRIFTEPLKELMAFEESRKELKTPGVVEINGLSDSVKLNIIHGLSDDFKFKIIVTFSEQKARQIAENYSFFDKNTYVYPAKDLIFYQADIHGNLLEKERLNVLKAVFDNKPCTIVTTFDALMNFVPPAEKIAGAFLSFRKGDEITIKELVAKLIALGYERVYYQVEDKGQFIVRGGIVDIYPLSEENPVRIDFFGDEIDSIRVFDATSQRSYEFLDCLNVFPASEMILSDEEKREGLEKIEKDCKKQCDKLRKENLNAEAHTLEESIRQLKERVVEFSFKDTNLDAYYNYFYKESQCFYNYFDSEETVFILDEPKRLKEMGELVFLEFSESMKNRLLKGYALPKCTNILRTVKETFSYFQRAHTLTTCLLSSKESFLKPKTVHTVIAKDVTKYNSSFENLLSDLLKYKKQNYKILLVSSSKSRAERISADLRDEDINAFFTEDLNRVLSPGEIAVVSGKLKQGYEFPLIKTVFISESDIFTERVKSKRRKKIYDGKKINSMHDLTVGDYVVHENHGLGIYQGIEKVTVNKITRDFMKISYKDGGNLFIPASNFDELQKYASKEGVTPKINKLGTKEWENAKAKVKLAVEEIADDLVNLYATRQVKDGYEFSKDTVWQKEFEEQFPFDETADQLTAIEATKKDMESKKIMDRLICGDVGYGKTEIAIRAAFKAVMEGKQVVYLCPTTILAGQHFNTFTERMKDYPVKIELLSRFKTKTEQTKIIKALKAGQVDIVIGTHRLLSKDVAYKDLGLLIIDEEQRFGVAHKEKIKQIRENVDVLTLSATPIPRTLHMSLIGVRDMSLLEEAPEDRLPIQTFVLEYNEELVREAIKRELSRGGQVFYVYNKINTIADMAARIKDLVPEAEVDYAHGRMDEKLLEAKMYDFVSGNIDILVSTTIIETGLDIPNVNTMIIHDSDRMGLGQLYQLRGRVGRSNRTAYAFLMYKKDKLLKETAEKRLAAIRDFTELGSGFKIAMRDLEIRGAGNILGKSQSGHMAAVGYELYCKMLNEAVKKRKGIKEEADYSVLIDIILDAFIPDNYIKNEQQKLDIYKRISEMEEEDEIEDIKEELTDRFGSIPKGLFNLLDIALLKGLCRRTFVTKVKSEGKGLVYLYVRNDANYELSALPKFLSKYRNNLSLKNGKDIYFVYRMPRGKSLGEDEVVEVTKVLRDIEENLLVLSGRP